MSVTQSIKIGGATGFWGETDLAMAQFLSEGDLDYIVFDYLAEITMSILARARSSNDSLGYATDFVTAMVQPNLHAIADSGVKLISNAGGVNPEACAKAIRECVSEAGLDLKVAVIVGDDLLPRVEELSVGGAREMFSAEPMPAADKIASVNAYIGAFPVAEALIHGADIVITGRCVDSAVTLGACIHAFGWTPDELDRLAAGSLVGHLIECGPQVTGGNFTDWEAVAESLFEVGYPIAQVSINGEAVITKPEETGGIVNRGTVGEQLLYEIDDPAHYVLPDVICDFSSVELQQIGENQVHVKGAKGRGVPTDYKVSMTWADGWRAGTILWYLGRKAAEKGRLFADEVRQRAEHKLAAIGVSGFDDVTIEIVGDESHWGESARYIRSREVAVKIGCRHQDKRAVALLLREVAGAGLGAPPGLAFFAGTRAKPSPVIRLFSIRVPKSSVPLTLIDSRGINQLAQTPEAPALAALAESIEIPTPSVQDSTVSSDLITVPLERLAWGRSGDKGDKANIGIMARDKAYLPWIADALTSDYVAARFAHLMTSPAINRFYLPGLPGLNFVLHNALGGGGVASLRNDPQAKSFAQILLDAPISIPQNLLDS
ncbi:MAG: DUF1446 domain-containing protein [Luminiphilus sp.]|nr:DUF1446 domain-containing protein [Luminiphilus sp.]